MDNQYGGMTVNERLYVSGLLKEFYKAVEEKNKEKVILILNKVEITGDSLIIPILEQFGFMEKQ
jgi:hypothetical protein